MPRADNMPTVEFVSQVTEVPFNLLGAKGVGEAGTIGVPPAIVNAALDALRPLSVSHLDMPLTSNTVWHAIRAASKKELHQ